MAALNDSGVLSDQLTVDAVSFLAVALADSGISSDRLAPAVPGGGPTITATALPIGGAVLLEFSSYFPPALSDTILMISRAVYVANIPPIWIAIYNGPLQGAFVDAGDGTPGPLDASQSYLWQCTDNNGTTIVGPVQPVSSFINHPDQLTQLLIRSLQGALNSTRLPPGVQRTQVTTKMPTNGWQAMPFIVVNLDLIQQTEVEIGEDVPNPDQNNQWILWANASRLWRITIMAVDVEERDFYRDLLLKVLRVLKATVFTPIGLNVSHTFSAESYTSVQEWDGIAPGFHGADVLFEIDGLFPAAVMTQYKAIRSIEQNPTFLPLDIVEVIFDP